MIWLVRVIPDSCEPPDGVRRYDKGMIFNNFDSAAMASEKGRIASMVAGMRHSFGWRWFAFRTFWEAAGGARGLFSLRWPTGFEIGI